MRKKQKRHMLNILEQEYQVIYDYCNPKNLIIGRWVSSVCIAHIKHLISGSCEK